MRYLSLFFHRARTLQASQLVRAWTFLSLHKQTAITRDLQIVIKFDVIRFPHYQAGNQTHDVLNSKDVLEYPC